MSDYIDVHNHVLPIDDGAKDWEDALIMIKDAVESGFSTVFVTPHIIPKGKYDPKHELIKTSVEQLQSLIQSQQLPISVKWGSEFQINSDAMQAIEQKRYLPYQDTSYLLVEFLRPYVHFAWVDQALDELVYQGLKIVIAHPERYFDDVEDALSTCYKWVKQGYYLQVNRTSLFQSAMKLHRRIALKLIDAGYVHLVASDAHHAQGKRRLVVQDTKNVLSRYFGKKKARCLLVDNPRRLMLDHALKRIHSKFTLRLWVMHIYLRYVL